MQARRTLAPGQKGTKKFLDRYGAQLVCVRYRYDEQQHKRFTTVELIVDESGWHPAATFVAEPVVVGLRVALHEVELQRRVKQAGGKWNRENRVWEIASDQAVALGLAERIEPPKVSNTRHQQVAERRQT